MGAVKQQFIGTWEEWRDILAYCTLQIEKYGGLRYDGRFDWPEDSEVVAHFCASTANPLDVFLSDVCYPEFWKNEPLELFPLRARIILPWEGSAFDLMEQVTEDLE